MSQKLEAAIEAVHARAHRICEFLHEIEPGEPVDEDALKEAIHDCANVTASMQSLKRVAAKL